SDADRRPYSVASDFSRFWVAPSFGPTSTRPGEPKVGLWGRIAARVVTRPVTTLIIGLVIFGSLAVASFGNSPSGFASASTAPKGSDSYYGTQILNKEFPSSSFNPTEIIFKFKRSVWSNLSNIEAMQTDLSHQSTLKSVFGPFNVLATKFSASQLSALNAQLGS
ncbi:MMPL domain protein, partial [mine drainage metagenome]